jgi:uroporphyrinogen decarboxylase
LLGFVGAPWTIATYIVEGGMTNTYTNIKSMCHTAPDVLKGLLSHLAQAISDYIIYQVNSGAQCIQIFDSWGGQLPPHVWEQWSKPYIKQVTLPYFSCFHVLPTSWCCYVSALSYGITLMTPTE